MFKFVKFFLVALLVAVSLSACATHSTRSAAAIYVQPEVVVEYPAIDLSESFAVEIKTPDLEIKEIPIPMQALELHERALIVMSEKEISCMTDVIYFEAKSESSVGQAGVGYAVLNRMGHSQYPKTACGVAYDRKHGCQFSWACKGRVSAARHPALHSSARQMAIDVMEGRVENPIGNSTQFRQKQLRAPRAMVRFAVIGNHSFYASRQ